MPPRPLLPLPALTLLLAALLLAGLGPLRAAPPLATRPHILWIVLDDIGGTFPHFGQTALATPNLDRLAREGTRFANAFLTASVCSPSRSALITGMYQTTIAAHHHRSGRGSEKIYLPPPLEPLPALLQRVGYYTCNTGDPAQTPAPGKTDYNFQWSPRLYDGIDWSTRAPGQPFFAQIQLWGGKNRNDNGRWYRQVAPPILKTLTDPAAVTLPPYYPRDPLILADWAQYLDCIRYSDWQIGQILQRLQQENLLDQTLLIVLGDNGISAAREKQFLYDGGIRTPLFVRGSGIPRDAVRRDLVEHIDLAATALAWAGLPIPSWMQGRDLFATAAAPRDAVFAARDRCDETVDRIRSVRTLQFKYLRNFHPQRPLLQPNDYKDSKPTLQRLRQLHADGQLSLLEEATLFAPTRPTEELYDLAADPAEIHNLASDPAHRATLESLRARLDRWIAETRDPGPESRQQYDSDMAAAQQTQTSPAFKNNVALMKQWAREGK